MKYEKIWVQALEQIEEKISKPSFETWFKSAQAYEMNDGILTITTPNEFARDWVDTRYSELIIETLKNITDEIISIKVISREGPKDNALSINHNFTNNSRNEIGEIKELLLKMEERINDQFNEVSKRLDDLESKLNLKENK